MSQKEAEMERLWSLMQQLEREPMRKDEAGRKADFERKQREMAKLKAAYDKLAGFVDNPLNAAQQADKATRMLFNSSPEGGTVDLHPTSDKLDKPLPGGIDPRMFDR